MFGYIEKYTTPLEKSGRASGIFCLLVQRQIDFEWHDCAVSESCESFWAGVGDTGSNSGSKSVTIGEVFSIALLFPFAFIIFAFMICFI